MDFTDLTYRQLEKAAHRPGDLAEEEIDRLCDELERRRRLRLDEAERRLAEMGVTLRVDTTGCDGPYMLTIAVDGVEYLKNVETFETINTKRRR